MATRYIVTGAAGHLGSTILRSLQRSGAQVQALVLPEEQKEPSWGNICFCPGDVRDEVSLRPLFQGCEAGETVVIHTAGIIDISGRLTPAMREVNVEGTRNMLRLSMEHKVKRFVHVSSVHAIPELPQDETIQEVAQFSPDWVVGGYAKAKAEATQSVLDAVEQGLDAVVVHPSGILGPYDDGSNHLVHMVKTFLAGKLPAAVRGGYDFVDVRDVAKGCLLAGERGERGKCYILSGRYAEIRELLSLAGRRDSRKSPPTVPLWLAKAASPLLEGMAKRRKERPLYTKYSLYTLNSNARFSHERASRELGYHPRPLSSTMRDMVLWLSRNNLEALVH